MVNRYPERLFLMGKSSQVNSLQHFGISRYGGDKAYSFHIHLCHDRFAIWNPNTQNAHYRKKVQNDNSHIIICNWNESNF